MSILGMNSEDIVITSIKNKQPEFQLNHCINSVDQIFKTALKKEPRLLAYLSGYEYTWMKKGPIQIAKDYTVQVTYSNFAPENIDEVVIDHDQLNLIEEKEKNRNKKILLVTKNPLRIDHLFNESIDKVGSVYEGVSGWKHNSISFTRITNYFIYQIDFNYMDDPNQLQLYFNKAKFNAKTIWKKILGQAIVPQFVKPFLAFSYLTQECTYDDTALAEVEANPQQLPSDPIPHLSYGPLVEKRGVCTGFAWAFKRLMDEVGIECLCIAGHLKSHPEVGHMWNLVKLDNQYYHLDPDNGVKEKGVYVDLFMQPDGIFKNTHFWNYHLYPKAKGIKYDYDFIEDYLSNNGMEFLDDGANEKYMFPDNIYD